MLSLCWYVWIPSLVCLTPLEKEVAWGVGGHLAKKDVFINTKHQEIKKHDIPNSWTNAELKHFGSSQLSNWNASTKNKLKVRTFRCDSQNIMQNMIQWHCYVCQLSADMNMHVIHHNHIVKYARTYHMMSCIVYQYIYMYMIYVLFYASQQTKKLGRLCILSTLTPDHQPMVGPSSDLPQPVSFAFRNSQKTCPSRWGHSENPRKSHRHIKSCILFCSRRNYGVNCSWTKIQSPQVEPPTIYQGFYDIHT